MSEAYGPVPDADARWLLADFQVPASGVRRLRARVLLAMAYRAFRIATKLPATQLVAPDDVLIRHGFALRERMTASGDLLHSDLWARG